MNAHLKSSLIPILLTPAILFVGGCQLSTAESQAQSVAKIETQKTITPRAVQPPLKLLPVDESNLDASFQEFRNQLTIAVNTFDKEFLLSVLDRKVDNGYDIEPGVNEFKKIWKLDSDTSVWKVLSGILAEGGTFNESRTEFCGPYTVSQWDKVTRALPEGAHTLDYVAAKGKDVPVRRDPRITAPVVATLSYDVVEYVANSQIFDPSNPGASWSKVKTSTGQEGFVLDKNLGGPMDYAACFTRKNDKWIITRLSARE